MKNDNEKSVKIRKKFYCRKCDYTTSDKKDWNKHILTRKHKKSAKADKIKPTVEFKCNFCDKIYKYKSGLCRHRKKCRDNPENFCGENGNVTQKLPSEKYLKKGSTLSEKKENEDDISLKEILMLQLKQQNETIELLKQSIETNTKMMPKIGNNNNNTISINFFLNEQCKNAMNLTDFIQNMNVDLEDLDYSKDNGFIKGVTNIFTKQLKDLKPTERPIHCSDKKRLQFYVKDNNEWKKDEDNVKIDETIYNIKMQQTKKLTEWEKLHPNYSQDPKLLTEWQQILNSMTEDVTHRDKVKDKLKRNLAEHVQLKQALTDTNQN